MPRVFEVILLVAFSASVTFYFGVLAGEKEGQAWGYRRGLCVQVIDRATLETYKPEIRDKVLCALCDIPFDKCDEVLGW